MNPAMIKKLQKMQKDMLAAQKRLEESVFYGSAGGKMVTVEVKGSKEVVSVSIEPDSFESKDDIEMIEDMVVAALNDAMKQIEKETEETMGQFTQGMGGMPGLF